MSKENFTNTYHNYYKDYSSAQLYEIIEKTELYIDEVRLTAYQILEERKEIFSDIRQKEKRKLEESFKKDKALAKEPVEEIQTQKPELYSPAAIIGFTLFLAPIVGAILLAINLKQVGKAQVRLKVILTGVFFTILPSILLFLGYVSQWIALGANIISGILFVELFWKTHIGYQIPFSRKPIWKPIVIAVSALLILSFLLLKTNPELVEAIQKGGSQKEIMEVLQK